MPKDGEKKMMRANGEQIECTLTTRKGRMIENEGE